MKKIKIILGSVRTQRAGILVANWVNEEAKRYQGQLDFEFLDLLDVNLPFMDEPVSPMASNDYVHEHTKTWSNTINDGDGFIFITPEYNHGYSPVLKNALDFLYKEWQDKPVALIGYGGSGARDAIRQLREVLNFIGLKPLDDQIGIGKIWEGLNPDNIRGNLQELFNKLENAL